MASAAAPATIPAARQALFTNAPARATSIAVQLVALCERPRARDAQDVGVPADVVGERRVGTGHLDNLRRGGIEDPLAGFLVDLDLLDAAVGADEHGQDQAAVQLVPARHLRIVEVAYP